MLHQAARKLGDRIGWIGADAARLPLPSQAFDWVICANCFHYFREPVAALREMHRVLRPGGAFVLVDWCDDYLSCKLCSWWLHWTDPAFHRTYTLSECDRLLQRAGLHVVQHERFRMNWLWGLMRFIGSAPAEMPDGRA